MPYFRPASEEDCFTLAPNLRALDLKELHINYPYWLTTSEEALVRCVDLSEQANAIILGGECVGLFGVSLLPDARGGAPWFLCSDQISDGGHKLFRQGRRWVNRMLAKYHHLENVCLYEHEESRNFIEAMGFRLTKVFDLNGEKFQHFEMDWRN